MKNIKLFDSFLNENIILSEEKLKNNILSGKYLTENYIKKIITDESGQNEWSLHTEYPEDCGFDKSFFDSYNLDMKKNKPQLFSIYNDYSKNEFISITVICLPGHFYIDSYLDDIRTDSKGFLPNEDFKKTIKKIFNK